MEVYWLNQGRIQGGGPGGPGPPLSENLGIDFYSGFRIFFHVYTFIVASEKKNTRGGVQFEILRNPGIDCYSGLKNPGIHFHSGFREKKHEGGGCNSKS